jgi:hypothetical protein
MHATALLYESCKCVPQCSFHGLTSSIHMHPILLKRQHKTAILCDMPAAFYVEIRQVLQCAGVLKAAFHTVDLMNQVKSCILSLKFHCLDLAYMGNISSSFCRE